MKLFVFALFLFISSGSTNAEDRKLDEKLSSSATIRSRIQSITEELQTLPKTSPIAGPSSLGLQSMGSDKPDKEAVLEISFDKAYPIDLIVIFPAIIKGHDGKYEPLGFPKRFILEVVLPNGEYESFADFTEKDYPIQGIEPQLFSCDNKKLVTGIRLTTTLLDSHEAWPELKYRLVISEIMVFADQQNVALQVLPKFSEPSRTFTPWNIWRLTDGFFPFSPIDEEIFHYRDFQDRFAFEAEQIEIVFDFKTQQEIDAIRLWPLAFAHYQKYAASNGHGFPYEIVVSIKDDLNGPFIEYRRTNPYASVTSDSNPLEIKIPQVKGRYLKISASKPIAKDLYKANQLPQMGIAELEVLSKGVCISENIQPEVIGKLEGVERTIIPTKVKDLTDGIVDGGKIHPLRSWILQINRRFQLERELAILNSNLLLAIRKEKYTYEILALVSIGIILALGFLLWAIKLRAAQKVWRVRDQIACDLHDHIGANLSSLALYHQLIESTIQNPTEEQSRLLKSSIKTAELTAKETSQIVKFLERTIDDESFVDLLMQSAQQIFEGVEFECEQEARVALQKLSHSKKWDLLSFTKEALNNIIKHSSASLAEFKILKMGSYIQFIISDNGRGIKRPGVPLVHLEKRVKKIGGVLHIQSGPQQGTLLELKFK